MEIFTILALTGALLAIVLLALLLAFILKPRSNHRRPVREDLQKIKAQIEDKAYI
jgi:type II secretory pathway component PulM